MYKLTPPLVLLLVSLTGCGEEKSAPAPTASAAPTQKAAGSSAAEDEKTAPMEQKVLAEGDAAPAIEMTLQSGEKVKLAEQKGLVLVYFYPKDDTPGCTVEAQGLRDNYADLQKAGVKVYGVSMQDAASHKAFIEKHELPFDLVVDDGAVARAFDVPVKGEFASRHSFLLKDGKVVKAWRQVSPPEHAKDVLAAAGEA